MNVSKNPHYRAREEIDAYNRIMTINAEHLCRLLFVLFENTKYHFYRKRGNEFLAKYCESVEHVQSDGDKEVRRYRFNELLKDAPYITYSRAENILDCQEGFAAKRDRQLYIEHGLRSDLIDNIVLALLTLHYDFGFGEERISRVMTEWAQCHKPDAIEWAEKRLGADISGNSSSDVYEWLKANEIKKQRVTIAEEKSAKRGLEAFRKYLQEAMNR